LLRVERMNCFQGRRCGQERDCYAWFLTPKRLVSKTKVLHLGICVFAGGNYMCRRSTSTGFLRSSFRLALLFVGIVCVGTLAAQQTPAGLHEFISVPLSYNLKAAGGGLEVSVSTKPSACQTASTSTPLSQASLQDVEVQLATLAHHAIFLEDDPYPIRRRIPEYFRTERLPARYHSPEWRSTLHALRKSGYTVYDYSTSALLCVVAIPSVYKRSSAYVDPVMDDALDPQIQNYISEWRTQTVTIKGVEDQVRVLDAAVLSKAATLQTLVAEETALGERIRSIKAQLGARLSAFDFVGLLPQPKYDADADYLRSVLQKNLSPIPKSVAIDGGVPDAVLDPELNAALEKFLTTNGDQLKEWKLTPFTIVSAARTPINQASQKGAKPVVAGTLTGGHCQGEAFDFQIAGSAVDIKSFYDNQATPEQFDKLVAGDGHPNDKQAKMFKRYQAGPKAYHALFAARSANWNKLQSLMKEAGLDLSHPGVTDANHVFLAKYVSNKLASRLFAGRVKLKMMSAYFQAMKLQKAAQDTKVKDLVAAVKQKLQNKFNLDQNIQDASKKIEGLKLEVAKLTEEKSQRDKEAAQREARNRPDRGDTDRHGADHDEYREVETKEHHEDYEHARPEREPGEFAEHHPMPLNAA
jgi:hypothetical protein